MQLEFFPNGRGTTISEGFCSLFLWCPSNMQIKYQLRVGSHYAAPDEDTYNSRMGHGHSNFCLLDLEVDKDTDTLEVGCHILSFTFKEQIKGDAQCVNIIKTSAEALVAQEADMIYNRGVELVQWTIKDVLAKAKQVPRGCAICSPTFSVAGVRQMLMEFYPSGMSQQSKDGVMGLYLRCPNGTQLVVTLFAGKTEKGPLKAEFDGNTAKGMPEFCALAPEIVGDDLVVGIKVHNPRMEEQATVTELRL
jgi:hypothetical protein